MSWGGGKIGMRLAVYWNNTQACFSFSWREGKGKMGTVWLYLHCKIAVEETPVSQQPSPELHADDPKDEEDKEAQEKDVA